MIRLLSFSSFLFFLGCGGGEPGFVEKEQESEVSGLMELSSTTLIFSDLELGDTEIAKLTVTSVGEVPLEIERIDITSSGDGSFEIDEDLNRNISLEPSQSHEATITGVLEEAGTKIGELRIRSNDAENPDFRIVLCAYSLQGGDLSDCPD